MSVGSGRRINPVGVQWHKQVSPQWSLEAALAGLPLALIAVGPAVVASISDRRLPVYASQIAVAVLVIHVGFSVLAHRSYGGVPATMRWLLAGTVLLAVPLFWSTDPAAGMLAYLNFVAGTVGGVAIAQVWKRIPYEYSWIDVGYTVFLIAGTAQLLVSYSNATSVNSLHQTSPMPWGVTSVVAGGLVVAALILIARSTHLGRNRKYAVTLALVTMGAALLTLTRGAIIAACVGAVFFLWSRSSRMPQQKPRSSRSRQVDTTAMVRLLARAFAVVIPVAGFIAVEHVTDLRAQVNSQVHTNIEIRFQMYRLAWEEFLKSPLTGTGWASFRDVSLDYAGQSETFAHNLVVSMLQIGGLMSLPYLAALAYVAYRALRHGGPYTAAVAASIAISMTQPFFESTVCNLIILPVAFLAGLSTGSTPSSPPRSAVVSKRQRPLMTHR
jgi:hypothetical protein